MTRGSNKSVLWFCDGTSEVPHRGTNGQRRCQPMAEGERVSLRVSGQAVIVGWNDLATVEPELAAQLVDPSIAKVVTRSSNKSVTWFCEGTSEAPHPRYEWSAKVAGRSRGRGCAACSGQTVIVGWNDLATVDPELAAQLVDPGIGQTGDSKLRQVRPLVLRRQPSRSLTRGMSGQRVSPIGRKGNGCPACAGRAVIVGWNDLATVNPESGCPARGSGHRSDGDSKLRQVRLLVL